MQELINSIATKAGITAEQSTTAVNTVVEFIKTKLPSPLNTQVENFFNNKEVKVEKGTMETVGEKTDEYLGLAKEKATEVFGDATEKATEVLGDVKEKASELLDGVKGFFNKN